MSQDIVSQRVPHKHAEVIKAWSDGCEIQWRNYTKGEDEWCNHQSYLPPPAWLESCEYRVKPEKVYAVTQMTTDEMSRAWCNPTPNSMGAAMEELANAALRHAIDADQVVTKVDHEAALVQLGERLRDVAVTGKTYTTTELTLDRYREVVREEMAARELAIAEAVLAAAKDIVAGPYTSNMMLDFAQQKLIEISRVKLAEIILKVRP